MMLLQNNKTSGLCNYCLYYSIDGYFNLIFLDNFQYTKHSQGYIDQGDQITIRHHLT